MCRFLVYRGPETPLAEWLIRPANSLIHQSYKAREAEPLNGDGFGVGWYSPGDDPTPCLFTSLTPAWSNRNLRRLAVRIRSSIFFAHVRAATPGMIVSEQNCHPFRCGRFLWMHNGRIARFERVLRRLRRSLRDDLYGQIKGTTDSEHAFHVYLNQLGEHREPIRRALEARGTLLGDYRRRFFDLLHDAGDEELEHAEFADRMVEHLGEFPLEALEGAMRHTLAALGEWTQEAGGDLPSFYNFAVTDGRYVLATRFSDRVGVRQPSLYCTAGLTVPGADGKPAPAVVIASEPLTDVHETWQDVRCGHMVVVSPDCRVEISPIEARTAVRIAGAESRT